MAEPKKESWSDAVEAEEEAAKEMEKLSVNKKEEEAPIPSLEKRLRALDKHNMNRGKLVVEGVDRSSLFSIKSFQDLNLKSELTQGLLAMGYDKPSKIQETALPILLKDPPHNLIAQSQSGTGKTAAFVLTMLSRCDPKLDFPQALCLSPTRELARQIAENVEKMGKFCPLKMLLVVKDSPVPRTVTQQIIVGTPGRINDLVKRNILKLNKLRVFVLDEADVMIDKSSLGEQSIRLKRMVPPTCQILLFSATYKPKVREFAERVVPKPCVNISLKRRELTVDAIQQLWIDCKSEENKFRVLCDIYGYLTVGQSIIFTQTRKTATELARKMTEAKHTVSLLHGGDDMTPEQRDKVIDDFKNAVTRVLITTNVLARGIDILQVMLVINYDLPVDDHGKPDPQTYLHRIGRTGRIGRKGLAISFVHDQQTKSHIQYFEKFFQHPIEEFPADKIENLQEQLEKLEEENRKIMQAIARGELKDDEDEE